MEEEQINSYLTFSVNGGVYGVHVSKVVEILAYETPKTNTSDLEFVLGLTEHRGKILPLIDTGLKFGGKPISVNDQTYVIVLNVVNNDQQFEVAIAVDSVREVVEIPPHARKPIDPTYKPGYVDFASTSPEGNVAIFFNPDKVFTDKDVFSIAELIKRLNN